MKPVGERLRAGIGDDGVRLRAEVEALELEVDIALRHRDMLAGVVPADAQRALTPNEVQAKTNFAALEADVERQAADTLARLIVDRRRLLELFAADLRRAAAAAADAEWPARAVADRLLEIAGTAGLLSLSGASDIIGLAAVDHLGQLTAAAETGGRRLIDEAARQGVPTRTATVALSAIGADAQLELAARRLAVVPHLEAVRALRDAAAAMSIVDVDAATMVDDLIGAGQRLAAAPLDLLARNAVQAADGLGRQAASATLPAPAAIYSSELLDRATCGPCSLVDGHQYAELDTARKDYPTGIYRRCDGGSRCRGTLVFVWPAEVVSST